MRNRKSFRCLFTLGFVLLSLLLSAPTFADDPGKIQWGTPQEILARLSADKYELPKGWKEAVGDTKEIVVYNYGPLLPSDPATKANADIYTELTGIKVRFIELLASQMIQKETAMLVAKSPAADVVVTLEDKTLDFIKA
ncbi:MAG: hypothetical protein D6736_09675, partial [Nitrospinota bacterium]